MTAQDVAVGWHSRAVVSGVTLRLCGGESLVLLGPNGSGKSTLLRAVLGLSRPLSGTIERQPGWRAGFVPQRDATTSLLRLRAVEVVGMAAPSTWLSLAGSADRRRRATECLAAVGMESHVRHTFRDLSGGQRQRVLLARALAAEPTVLLLDEPTTGLDLRAEREFLGLVRSLRSERGMASVIVTHSLALARSEATSVGLLHDRRFHFGSSDELLTDERLSAVYGVAI